MNRRGFVGRMVAALGIGVLPSGGASGVTPPAIARGVTPPPAPSFPSILELGRLAEQSKARSSHAPTHFGCTRETLLDLISTIHRVEDATFMGKDVTVLGMSWMDSPDMEDGRLWCGRALTFSVR